MFDPDANGSSAPQANDPKRVVAAVAAVDAGCERNAEIADAIGVVERQGAYYAAAAESLGLVDRVVGYAGVMCWQTTPLGASLVALPEDEIGVALAEVIRAHPDVARLVDDGEQALSRALAADGLAAETVARRVSCARAWRDYADGERDHGDVGAEAARVAASARGVAARRARASAAAAPRFCADCYMQLPAAAAGEHCDACA